jgi:hypothetical protein
MDTSSMRWASSAATGSSARCEVTLLDSNGQRGTCGRRRMARKCPSRAVVPARRLHACSIGSRFPDLPVADHDGAAPGARSGGPTNLVTVASALARYRLVLPAQEDPSRGRCRGRNRARARPGGWRPSLDGSTHRSRDRSCEGDPRRGAAATGAARTVAVGVAEDPQPRRGRVGAAGVS